MYNCKHLGNYLTKDLTEAAQNHPTIIIAVEKERMRFVDLCKVLQLDPDIYVYNSYWSGVHARDSELHLSTTGSTSLTLQIFKEPDVYFDWLVDCEGVTCSARSTSRELILVREVSRSDPVIITEKNGDFEHTIKFSIASLIEFAVSPTRMEELRDTGRIKSTYTTYGGVEVIECNLTGTE